MNNEIAKALFDEMLETAFSGGEGPDGYLDEATQEKLAVLAEMAEDPDLEAELAELDEPTPRPVTVDPEQIEADAKMARYLEWLTDRSMKRKRLEAEATGRCWPDVVARAAVR